MIILLMDYARHIIYLYHAYISVFFLFLKIVGALIN